MKSSLFDFRNPVIRLRLALVVGAALGGVGTLGYIEIEHYSPLDAFYFTVITLSSVGYGTIRDLDTAGKIFTILLIIFGIGVAAWVFSTVVEVVLSEQLQRYVTRRRMDKQIDALRGHYIVCGYGRIGQEIAQGYAQNGVAFVVIEQSESRLEQLRTAGFLHVEGDASDDDALRAARIDHAAALIAVTPLDAVNTYIVLSARGLRKDLPIVTRADSVQSESKLYRAGATKVVSVHVLGGRWMSITAINPAVTEFLEAMTNPKDGSQVVAEYEINRSSSLTGVSFASAELKRRTGTMVLAVRSRDEERKYIPNPPDDFVFEAGDCLIAVGSKTQMAKLAAVADPNAPKRVPQMSFRRGAS